LAPPSPSIAAPPPPPDDYVLYCVDELQIVVDQTLCDLNGGYDSDYYVAYDRNYQLGLPIGTLLVGGLFVHAQDLNARNALKLSSTFRNGSMVRAGTVGTTGGGTTIGG
jgi:hypothetical protein